MFDYAEQCVSRPIWNRNENTLVAAPFHHAEDPLAFNHTASVVFPASDFRLVDLDGSAWATDLLMLVNFANNLKKRNLMKNI